MALTASKLRSDVYNILDRILETGEPVTIERNGRTLTISATPVTNKLDRLVTHPDTMNGDPDDFVEIDWSDEWQPDPL